MTVFVGDNGTGKSTLVEALAVAAGFNAEGGSRNLQFETYATHSAFASKLRLRWAQPASLGLVPPGRDVLRDGDAHHRDDDDRCSVRRRGELFPDLHHRSHGESFLTLIDSRIRASDGLYLLDEPESALSFHGQLEAARHDARRVRRWARSSSIATHSPMLMAYPECADLRVRRRRRAHAVSFDEVSVVGLWRTFLEGPDRYFRHLFDESAD